jgi:glucosylceramidase
MKSIIKNHFLQIIFLFIIGISAFSCSKSTISSGTPTPVVPTPVIPTPTPIVSSDVACWLTTADQSILFQKQNVSINFSSSSNLNNTITIDTTQSYQSIDGFGCALTGGSAYLINRLPSTDRDALLKELFTVDSTYIGISYLRISIGASDLNSSVFSYDDIPSGQTDTTLNYFGLGADTYDLIPTLKSIVALNPTIKILGCPWSAPLWMKTIYNSMGGSLKPAYYDVYAQYFVKYIQAMKAQGIHIDAITPQNEPLNASNNPSMLMQATEEADFVKNHLGPLFKAANLDTKIIVYDHNCDVPSYPITILNDPAANKYVDGSAFHLYAGDITALTQVHTAYPDKNVYFTEQYVGGPGNFANDLNWHIKTLIIGATRNWSKNVLEWNLASDPTYGPHTTNGCSTCLGALTIGTSVTRNVSYYIMAHAAKFVTPGSVRIATNLSGNLQNVAFKRPDGKKVLIVLNDSNALQNFNIQFNGKIATSTLAVGSVATYVW